jgi:hypothetical protein
MENITSFLKSLKEHPKVFKIHNKEMTNQKISKLDSFPKETIIINDLEPLCHEGFPSKFNLSVAEYFYSEWCKNHGAVIKRGVFDYTKIPCNSFWNIKVCSREEDLNKIFLGSNQHLLLFHIALTNGCHIIKKNEKVIREYYESFFDFFKKHNLDMTKITVSCFPGGVAENHGISKFFPEDVNKNLLIELSKKHGFKINYTTDQTFLTLRIFGSPIHWGYRNEFLYEVDDTEWDLGTIEYLPYKPVYELDKEGFVIYKDIVDTDNPFLGGGVGLERFLLMIENKKNISELSIIKPLFEIVKKYSKNKDKQKSILLVLEILKLYQYLVCEVGGLSERFLKNKNRKNIISKYRRVLVSSIISLDLDFSKDFLKEFTTEVVNQYKVIDGWLKTSDEIIDVISKEVFEKLRVYNVSVGYKQEINDLIKDYKL